MDFTYRRSYKGPVKLVILDWAGTTLDYGCYAPAVVFVEVFKRRGVEITMEQARRPMGLKKLDHIRAISRQDEVAKLWKQIRGKECTEADVQEMFEKDFVPLQVACIADYSELIPGTVETVNELKGRGIKIGSTTGYFTEAMEINLREAKKQGYDPDVNACASDVPAGRPAPWMVMSNMQQASVFPPEAVVKVDDTKPGISEGLNAGTWTIGVAKTGNEVGLNQQELAALPAEKVIRKVDQAADGLAKEGAHYVIESIAALPAVISEIEQRLKMGDRP
ncbi:MAG TPA: phosphonoacetaldehyde hydrolase [Sedimentisphaerales bacterium]|nr:phosphonoacetaldehyde hydrolase [Sedimentisphaerales bacterium]